ncbi:protein required for normal CLN1 and CLN2 G1 cyclin expression [Tilletia horrida]|nr:protein required for normal CLN1 and CLN2 G1 cyclin expression [Tilletia horrida]
MIIDHSRLIKHAKVTTHREHEAHDFVKADDIQQLLLNVLACTDPPTQGATAIMSGGGGSAAAAAGYHGGHASNGNGHGHGHTYAHHHSLVPPHFVLPNITLPVASAHGGQETDDIDIPTDDLLDNINDIVEIFQNEPKPLPTRYVRDVALQFLFQGGHEQAVRVLRAGLDRLAHFRPHPEQERLYEKWPLATLLAALNMSLSRAAPKVILPDAKYQILKGQQPKAAYLAEAHALLFAHPNRGPQSPNLIESRAESQTAVMLSRALLLSLSGALADLDASLKLYESVLDSPGNANNAVALLGKASILLRKRMYLQALRTYQHALKVTIVLNGGGGGGNSNGAPQQNWRGPDPRIGIGLCLHALGRTDDARTAWTRAAELAAKSPYPQSSGTSASLLLAISSLNIARSTTPLLPGVFGAHVSVKESVARDQAYAAGIKSAQEAFQAANATRSILTSPGPSMGKNAMAAVLLAEHFCERGRLVLSEATEGVAGAGPSSIGTGGLGVGGADEAKLAESIKMFRQALKLGEHAIQYADSRQSVVHAWLIFARTAHLASVHPRAHQLEVGAGANGSAPIGFSAVGASSVGSGSGLSAMAMTYFQRVVEDITRAAGSGGRGGGPGGAGGMSKDAAGGAAGNANVTALPLALLSLAQLQLSAARAPNALATLDLLFNSSSAAIRGSGVGAGAGSASALASSLPQHTLLEPGILSAALRSWQSKQAGTASAEERVKERERAKLTLERALRMVEGARAEVALGASSNTDGYGLGGADEADGGASGDSGLVGWKENDEERAELKAEAAANLIPPEQAPNDDDASAGEVAAQLLIARSGLANEGLGRASLKKIARLGREDPLLYAQMAELLENEHSGRRRAGHMYWEGISRVNELLEQVQRIEGEEGPSNRTKARRAELLKLRIYLRTNLGSLLVLRGMQASGFGSNTPWTVATESGAFAVRTYLLERGREYLETALSMLSGAESAQLQVSAANLGAGAALASGSAELDLEPVKVIAAYNVGRAYELMGQLGSADDAFSAVLAQHPEYVDARVRLAILSVSGPNSSSRDRQTAANLFREALASDPSDLDARAAFVCFLAGELPGSPTPPQWNVIKDLSSQLFCGPTPQGIKIFGTPAAAKLAQEEGRKDAFMLASLGWAYYQIALHTSGGPNSRAERSKGVHRAADLYDKALEQDPRCAFAAQGMAILLAEDIIGDLVSQASQSPAAAQGAQARMGIKAIAPKELASANVLLPAGDVEIRRRKGAELALGVLSKLREVRDDGSVFVCMGHALMNKDENERALKAYELASSRYYEDKDPLVLQYLARAEYALGVQRRSPAHLKKSVDYLKAARAIWLARDTPAAHMESKFARYNAAVTAQKRIQMLFELDMEKKTLEEMKDAVASLQEAQESFAALLPDAKAGSLSFIDQHVIDQRIQYGESSLLRQSDKALADKAAHEAEVQRVREIFAATQREKEEAKAQARAQAEEAKRAREAEIAAERKKAREEAQQIEYIREPTPDPAEKKAARKKKSSGNKGADADLFSGDEDDLGEGGGGGAGPSKRSAGGAGSGAPKEKKRKKIVTQIEMTDSEDGGDDYGDRSEDERPKKKKKKKITVSDLIDSDEEMF